MIKSSKLLAQLGWMFCRKFRKNKRNGSIQNATTRMEHVEDVDIRIFSVKAVNREENKLGIGCIVYTRQN